MAKFPLFSSSGPVFSSMFFFFFAAAVLVLLSASNFVASQPPLGSPEQEAVYRVLESVSPGVRWRSLFPDDLCSAAPHGVVCDVFEEGDGNASASASGGGGGTSHITELNFGYVSDYSPNPPCAPKSTLDHSLLARFTRLRKLFFYQCFTQTNVSFPDLSPLGPTLEEVVFIDNPALTGSLRGNIGHLKALRRFVLTGSNVSGDIPAEFRDFTGIEQVTLSRNKLMGNIPADFPAMKKLRVLDLSQNEFSGAVPLSIGNLTQLLKLDLSFNRFSGEIPGTLSSLKELEFLDLSYNGFAGSGFPSFVSEMPGLKEVYLSGNMLGGEIPPEIWEHMGGILGIGLSGTGLVGKIPVFMGVHLRNVNYLGLDNNRLEGTVPEEFGALELVNELNLENNNLSGKVPFSPEFATKVGEKLKLHGNPHLCVDEGLRSAQLAGGSLGTLKLCSKPPFIPQRVPLPNASPAIHASTVVKILGALCLFF
ncbi:unnamed protein product [Cuscuta campestris]|uniref:Leucine-rich repeat-containing N-terminal plant-type domain-containing protein n=1 Tax=Cuscuta campestris TaxID=132261 RepID=A0A484MBX0_9ASTE|nr:unnamed protein product [Cuscuta campestris]